MPGLRCAPARSGPPTAHHPQLVALAAAGITVEVVAPASAAEQAARFRTQAVGGVAVWLAAADGDERFLRALADQVSREPQPAELEVIAGSYDLPGARLLDAVAVMDRLRSPGGCPWDAEQTHASLGKYLLEEAYEAYEAIEEGDSEALREEMGDVLLQVLFHARLAQETDDGWSIDDAAGDLVDKLVNRHPHVFGDDPGTGEVGHAGQPRPDVGPDQGRREGPAVGDRRGPDGAAVALAWRPSCSGAPYAAVCRSTC